jgi:hypothetical protein
VGFLGGFIMKRVTQISKEAALLFTDEQLIFLLRCRGVDMTRKTRVDKNGAVWYVD